MPAHRLCGDKKLSKTERENKYIFAKPKIYRKFLHKFETLPKNFQKWLNNSLKHSTWANNAELLWRMSGVDSKNSDYHTWRKSK